MRVFTVSSSISTRWSRFGCLVSFVLHFIAKWFARPHFWHFEPYVGKRFLFLGCLLPQNVQSIIGNLLGSFSVLMVLTDSLVALSPFICFSWISVSLADLNFSIAVAKVSFSASLRSHSLAEESCFPKTIQSWISDSLSAPNSQVFAKFFNTVT